MIYDYCFGNLLLKKGLPISIFLYDSLCCLTMFIEMIWETLKYY